MNVVNFNEKSCERFQRYFDSYLDNELLVETNHEVLRHLSSCPNCMRLLEARSRLKKAVKQVVMQEEAPAILLESIQNKIRRRRSFFAPEPGMPAIAVAAVLILSIGIVISFRGVATTGKDVFQLVSDRAQAILRIGLVDHVHCAIQAGNWKRILGFEQMRDAKGPDALGTEFIGIVPLVKEKLGRDFQIIQGHRCAANGREYVHLILTGANGTILSLVITEKNGETFTRADVAATLEAAGVSLYADTIDDLQITGFETNRFLAYVVSNLDPQTNLKVASTVAPTVYHFLRRLEI